MAERPTNDAGPDETSESRWPAWARWAGVAFVILLALGLVNAFNRMSEPPPLDSVRVGTVELRGATKEGDRWVVDRTAQPTLVYRPRLENVPPRARMRLSHEWVSPQGTVSSGSMTAGTGRFGSSSFTPDYQLPLHSSMALGLWSVRLNLDGRLIDQTAFEVRDGPNPKGPPK
jgi:hypothetical protein